MGYKKWDKVISFADLEVKKSVKHNRRSLAMMNRISRAVNWSSIEVMLKGYYDIGAGKEGADAYPPSCCSRPCCSRSDFIFPLIRSSKIRSMSGSRLINSWIFAWKNQPLTTPPSPGSVLDYRKRP